MSDHGHADAVEPVGPAARGFARALVTSRLAGHHLDLDVLERAADEQPAFAAEVTMELVELVEMVLLEAAVLAVPELRHRAEQGRIEPGDREKARLVAADLWVRLGPRLAHLEHGTLPDT